jgi:cell division septal protein FtsQ
VSSLLRRNKNRRRAQTPLETPLRALRDPASRQRILRGIAIALGLCASGAAIAVGSVTLHRFITRSPHFAVREVRLPPLSHVAAATLRARTGVASGENLFAVDLDDVRARLRREPWLESVEVHRELPSAIAVEAEERTAACAVAMGAIYLADASGVAWKRASPEEAASVPLVTGVARAAYIHDRRAAQALVREGLIALSAWKQGGRPAIGEIHVDAAAGVTLYQSSGGLSVRLGHGDAAALGARLARVDAVLRALATSGEKPQVIYADQPHHPERVTVRLAAAAGARAGI